MKIVLIVLFFLCSFILAQTNERKIQPGEIKVYPLPSATNQEPPFCAYGMVDVPGNYEEYYNAYKNNTKDLEDDNYKRKETLSEEEGKASYQLVFSHWPIGELFRLQEDHTKVSKATGWMISKNLSYPGVKEANAWMIKKYLLEKTKSSWVGDSFKYLQLDIAFIDMGKDRTRIYTSMSLDAKDKRTLLLTKEEVRGGMERILRCKNKEKEK